MGRTCPICSADLSSYVRDKCRDYPNQPGAVLTLLKKYKGLEIKIHQLKYHLKAHDIAAGTNIQVRRGLEERRQELDDTLAASRKIVKAGVRFMEKVSQMEEFLDPEKFKDLSFDKQVETLAKTQKLALDYKRIEQAQQKLDQDKNPLLERMNRVAAGGLDHIHAS